MNRFAHLTDDERHDLQVEAARQAIAENVAHPQFATIVHVAGPVMETDNYRGQLCARCGATLLSYDLERVAAPLEPGETWNGPAMWGEGDMVAHVIPAGADEGTERGGMWSLMDHEPGAPYSWAPELTDPSERWCTE